MEVGYPQKGPDMAPYIFLSFLFHVAALYALGQLSVAVITFHSVPLDFHIVDRVPRGVDAGVPAKTISAGKAKKKTAKKKPPQIAKAVKKPGRAGPGKGAATALKSSLAKAAVPPARDVSKGAALVGKPSEALPKQEARAGGGLREEPRPVAAAVANAATFGAESKKATAIEEKPSLKEVAAIIEGEEATRVVVRPTPEVTVSVTMKGSQKASWARSGNEDNGAAAPDRAAVLSGYEDIYYMPLEPLRPERPLKEAVNPDAPVVKPLPVEEYGASGEQHPGAEEAGKQPGEENKVVGAPSLHDRFTLSYPDYAAAPHGLQYSLETESFSGVANAASLEPEEIPEAVLTEPLPVEEYGASGEQHLGAEEAGKQPGEENKAVGAPFPYDRFTISYPDYAAAPHGLQYSLETESFSGVANAASLEPEEIPEAVLTEPLPVEEYAASVESSLGAEEADKQPGEEDKAGDASSLHDRFTLSYPDDAAAPHRLEYSLEIETSLDVANVISLEPGKMPEAAVAEDYSILDALFPVSSPEEENLGILAAVITPESATPSNEEYMERVEGEAKSQAKGDGALSGNPAVLAAPGEIVITIEPRGDAEGLWFGLFKKPHPMAKVRRDGNAQIAAQSVLAGEGPKKSVFEFEMADKAVYTFMVENKGAASRVFSVEFRLRGGRLKFYREVSLGTEEAKSFKFLMPEAVFWDDEERFSGSIEGADSVTKFDDASGLVWKEEKQY